MRNIIFLLLFSGLVFTYKPAHAGIPVPGDIVIAPLFADMQDWLPDFGEWYEKGMKSFVEPLAEKVREFINGIKHAIKSALDAVISFFNGIWQSVCGFIDTTIKFFHDIWKWLLDSCDKWFMLFCETVLNAYEWVGQLVLDLTEWYLESGFYVACCIFETILKLLDEAIDSFFKVLIWLIGLLPEFIFPDGFEQGMNYFITYGMIMNKIMPVKEALYALSTYLTFLIAVTIYSLIKSWIPAV